MKGAASIDPTEISGSGFVASPHNTKPRIRILHSVGHLLRGGIETWLYQVLQRLDVDCFEHHVLVRTDKKEPFTEAFEQAGIRVLPCLNYGNPTKYASNLRRVVRHNGPYDILHVHGSNPNGLLALLLAKPLGIPVRIVHSHNDVRPLLEARGFAYKLYVRSTLHCLRLFSDHGIAASVLAAESMFGSSWQTDARWKLLYYGMNFAPFAEPPDPDLRESLGIPRHAFVVGHVGRFHEQKNHEFLVRIADEVIKRCPEAHFLFIGDGELKGHIVSECDKRGLGRHVTFVRDTPSVPKFMLSAMDCFAFPSRYEGLGLVAVEAQAAGLPCVLSDRVPKEAIVDKGLVNVLQLKDSPELWADAILSLRRKRSRGTQHLEQFYSSPFNLDQCAVALARTYRSLAIGHVQSLSSEQLVPQR